MTPAVTPAAIPTATHGGSSSDVPVPSSQQVQREKQEGEVEGEGEGESEVEGEGEGEGEVKPHNVGTPQGDILSPVLFTIYLEHALKEVRLVPPNLRLHVAKRDSVRRRRRLRCFSGHRHRRKEAHEKLQPRARCQRSSGALASQACLHSSTKKRLKTLAHVRRMNDGRSLRTCCTGSRKWVPASEANRSSDSRMSASRA
ncbi:hypothetical protein ElyMa_001909700 [Elysia marginata]|uniref:Reverse transcriptase domain-containing protein n=1 Tax=Elysia marginata TaxID=1093978 RepID=A0AAV4ES41_9GAST|nr:hypothetical protein ElyMa_001909700 [Elysia marginata]